MFRVSVFCSFLLTIFAGVFSVPSAQAQSAAPDKCLAFAEAPSAPLLRHASVRLTALQPYQVNLKYLGHSTFLLESPKGITIATDYNDYIAIAPAPTVATMNLAHDTHHSMRPDPNIKHVLKGWNPTPGKAQIHDLTLKDVRIRNIPTNIRTFGDENAYFKYGNSIFVFEVSGLCIAHLGHLHHTLTVQAAQSDRANGYRPSACRRQFHLGRSQHDRCAEGTQGTADHPDALLLAIHLGPLCPGRTAGIQSAAAGVVGSRHFPGPVAGKVGSVGVAAGIVRSIYLQAAESKTRRPRQHVLWPTAQSSGRR